MLPNIFLVGPMGAGKTAVGRRLAAHLGHEFHDSDAEIESRTGVDIAYIFELEGEEGFRVRERAVIDELSQLPGIVLATGGGAILSAETRERLSSRGVVVYLEASLDQQWRRTRRSSHRPLLQTDDPRARLEQLWAEREPLYQSIARITVRTGSRKLSVMVDEIAAALRELE